MSSNLPSNCLLVLSGVSRSEADIDKIEALPTTKIDPRMSHLVACVRGHYCPSLIAVVLRSEETVTLTSDDHQ